MRALKPVLIVAAVIGLGEAAPAASEDEAPRYVISECIREIIKPHPDSPFSEEVYRRMKMSLCMSREGYTVAEDCKDPGLPECYRRKE